MLILIKVQLICANGLQGGNMLYRKLGKTNETVSILGFGAMRLPIVNNDSSNIDSELAIPMIRKAIDDGLTYVDTAYPYHGGNSEALVGKALKEGYREKVKLATKLPSWLVKTREDMDRLLNEQLAKLETESIDFYLVHALNVDFWANLTSLGIFEFLDSIKADGRVKHVGFSFHDKLDLFKEIVDAYDWEFCQIQYNYIDENYQAGKEGLEYAAERGLGIIIMEPLRGGRLVNDIPDEIQASFNQAETKRTPAEWALRWLWNKENVHLVLSGMSTMEQMEENMSVAAVAEIDSLSEAELAIMDNAQKIFNSRIKVHCTGCEYCMPCPFGVNIPYNFSLYNECFLFDSEAIKEQKRKDYMDMDSGEKASSCTECGACESHCPQNIQIRAKLKEVVALFESNI